MSAPIIDRGAAARGLEPDLPLDADDLPGTVGSGAGRMFVRCMLSMASTALTASELPVAAGWNELVATME
jgi:hypothetical protein